MHYKTVVSVNQSGNMEGEKSKVKVIPLQAYGAQRVLGG
jgi:hypothetical protein